MAAEPEMRRANSTEVVLQLLVAGVRDVGSFDFVSAQWR
jgi:HrpA-like RNA helicase